MNTGTAKAFVLLLILLVSTTLYGKGIIEATNDDDKTGVIKGKVLNNSTQEPMEFANIALYNLADSSLITGTITTQEGKFEMSNLTFGEYYMQVNFIGFGKTEINNISINKENKSLDYGEIFLKPTTLEIGSIDVVADKNAVEYKLDKKVVNVSQVINAAGGTAVDVLENTPSVQVDIEGNVTLRGSGNFTVLIDGRPSVLSGSEALRQIPASALENVEIITNPSAKYEPDGQAGIINLVMKKNSMNGLSGIVNASVGTGDKYRGDFTLNYRTNKFNITAGADWRDETGYGKMFSNRESYNADTTTYLDVGGERNYIRGGQNFKAGIEYFLSDKTTFSISGEAGKSKNNRGGEGTSKEYTIPKTTDIFSVTDENSKSENDFYSGTLNFQHKFNTEGHKIEAMAFYSTNDGIDMDEENEMLSDENYNPTDQYLARTQSTELEDEKEFRFKADYTLPINDQSRFEAGLQSRMDKEFEEVSFKEFDPDENDWIESDFFSSSTDFRRDIHAAYSTYSNKLGAFEFLAGLRGELTNREIIAGNDTTYSLNRFDLFPTLHTSLDIGENNELMASYSRRIDRPRGRDLDPTPSYYNRYTVRIGNPELEPEYTDSYDLGYMRKFGRSYVSLEAFRRITNNKIERIEELGDDGIYYLTSDNLNKDFSTGLELMGNVEFTKWLMVNASVTMFHYRITGELDGESIDRESTNWNGRMNTTVKFSTNSRMQIQGFYRGPSVSAQGESKSSFYSNIAYKQDLFQKKLTATLSLQDPFRTAKYERVSYGEDFKSQFKWEREPRVVMLTLSYKINNFKSDDRGGNSGGGMDMGGEM
ncbi:TonB-dependent receptor family protein [Draconibacterium sp.]|nr:TonB-dependent receptor family protein [Draconibacterium sp.]